MQTSGNHSKGNPVLGALILSPAELYCWSFMIFSSFILFGFSSGFVLSLSLRFSSCFHSNPLRSIGPHSWMSSRWKWRQLIARAEPCGPLFALGGGQRLAVSSEQRAARKQEEQFLVCFVSRPSAMCRLWRIGVELEFDLGQTRSQIGIRFRLSLGVPDTCREIALSMQSGRREKVS